ncbi:hypothetical protein CfE428DRAFT_2479 [Chthoniobacter flavus Ellin428]|uniref:Uncharacterized protein n=1 Tax=Chthoniobacter flavus Ellin428 TaxID=497964 RepID=B4D0M8_9BACT|nr:hypothetical protein [Chthoniobacter flavus]EDY19890.1 hypothetical protein CfE428DRAFT_2479 [Chthoniobacter flavus Ellin428]TCO91839.1 hypothetical protein EV701_107120 [Chthoniobacter flavus]
MKSVDLHIREAPLKGRNYAADEPMHPLQIRAYRRMTPAEKLDRMAALYESTQQFFAAGVRMRHPDWSEEQIKREVRDSILYGVS